MFKINHINTNIYTMRCKTQDDHYHRIGTINNSLTATAAAEEEEEEETTTMSKRYTLADARYELSSWECSNLSL